MLPITSCSLTNADLKHLYDVLESKIKEAAEYQVANMSRTSLTTIEDFEEHKNIVREAYTISIQIIGEDGETILASSRDVLDAVNLPNRIRSIQFDSSFGFREIFNLNPRNQFSLFLDLSKPIALDTANPTTNPTPNSSNFDVSGEDGNWVIAAHEKTKSFFTEKRTSTEWLHKRNTYDIFLILLGMPISFWLVFRTSEILQSIAPNVSSVFEVAISVYVFLLWLYIFRFLFSYAKWAWPRVEYSGLGRNLAKAHRGFWKLLAAGLFLSLTYDVITSIF